MSDAIAQNDLNFSFDILKINKEERLITGIATAENIDLAGEIVDFDASLDAFRNWVGNIREMHSPIAVGKMISFQPTKITFMGKAYRAIEVTVYVSKGAEDTWQKVLDGTLSGFSIGGNVVKRDTIFSKDRNQAVPVIKEYRLGELSLVDSPCNPTSKFSMVKSFDGELIYDGGENMNKDLHNKEDTDILTSVDDLNETQKEGIIKRLSHLMFGAGEEVSKGTSSFSLPEGIIPSTININLGTKGDEMVEKALDETSEDVEEEGTQKVDSSEGEASVEKAEDDTDGGIEMDLEKLQEVFGDLLDSKMETLKADIAEGVDAKIEKVAEEFTEKVDAVKASLEETNEEVTKVAESGGVKKSVDVETVDELEKEEIETIEKSAGDNFWGGVFVPQELTKALGYDS